MMENENPVYYKSVATLLSLLSDYNVIELKDDEDQREVVETENTRRHHWSFENVPEVLKGRVRVGYCIKSGKMKPSSSISLYKVLLDVLKDFIYLGGREPGIKGKELNQISDQNGNEGLATSKDSNSNNVLKGDLLRGRILEGSPTPARRRMEALLHSVKLLWPTVEDIMTQSIATKKVSSMLLGLPTDFAAAMQLDTFLLKQNPNDEKRYAILLCRESIFDVCLSSEYHDLKRQYQLIKQSNVLHDIERWCTSNNVHNDGQGKTVTESISCKSNSLATTAAMAKDESGLDDKNDQTYLQNAFQLVDEHAIQPLVQKLLQSVSGQQRRVHELLKQLWTCLGSYSRQYQQLDLKVYGSNVSSLSLEGCDVDISMEFLEMKTLMEELDDESITAKDYGKAVAKHAFQLRNRLTRFHKGCFVNVFALTKARIPVIKGTFRYPLFLASKDAVEGSTQNDCSQNYVDIKFDITFENHRGVENSFLLKQYVNLHSNVKTLCMMVKLWAHENMIANAPNGTLSSYGWTNLVIFYLQCIGYVPNLQCPQLIQLHKQRGYHVHPNHNSGVLAPFNTEYVTAKSLWKSRLWERPARLDDVSLTELLYGFWRFYGDEFPVSLGVVSICRGGSEMFNNLMGNRKRDVPAKKGTGSTTPHDKTTPVLENKDWLSFLVPKTVCNTSRIWRLCIEDPFETFDNNDVYSHDIGMHVDENGMEKIRKSLQSSAARMRRDLEERHLTSEAIDDIVEDEQHAESIATSLEKTLLSLLKQSQCEAVQGPSASQPKRSFAGEQNPSSSSYLQNRQKAHVVVQPAAPALPETEPLTKAQRRRRNKKLKQLQSSNATAPTKMSNSNVTGVKHRMIPRQASIEARAEAKSILDDSKQTNNAFANTKRFQKNPPTRKKNDDQNRVKGRKKLARA